MGDYILSIEEGAVALSDAADPFAGVAVAAHVLIAGGQVSGEVSICWRRAGQHVVAQDKTPNRRLLPTPGKSRCAAGSSGACHGRAGGQDGSKREVQIRGEARREKVHKKLRAPGRRRATRRCSARCGQPRTCRLRRVACLPSTRHRKCCPSWGRGGRGGVSCTQKAWAFTPRLSYCPPVGHLAAALAVVCAPLSSIMRAVVVNELALMECCCREPSSHPKHAHKPALHGLTKPWRLPSTQPPEYLMFAGPMVNVPWPWRRPLRTAPS